MSAGCGYRGLRVRADSNVMCVSVPRTPMASHPRTGGVHGHHRHQHASPPARCVTVRTHASAATADLAVYQFTQRRSASAADWFQQAVREIVKHVDQSPFLQTVQLGGDSSSPRFNTFGVPDSVVSAPQLWQSVAEHLSSSTPDVVILVQRVGGSGRTESRGEQQQQRGDGVAAAAAATNTAAYNQQGRDDRPRDGQQQQQSLNTPSARATVGHSSSAGQHPPAAPHEHPGSPHAAEARLLAEEACRRLLSSGAAAAVLQGQVGDCCEGQGSQQLHSEQLSAAEALHEQQQQQQKVLAPRALPPATPPFAQLPHASSPHSWRRAQGGGSGDPAVSAGAASSAAAQRGGSSACYWGVVVQSRRCTGADGCYLLKTVRSVTAGTGCCCTHFSLTRVSQGEHLEQQFVRSWLL